MVEEAGRLIGRTEANHMSPALIAGYRDLWGVILDGTSNLDAEALKVALAPFAWWFDSQLPGDWTLAELLALFDRGVTPAPTFALFRRLPSLAASHPEETL